MQLATNSMPEWLPKSIKVLFLWKISSRWTSSHAASGKMATSQQEKRRERERKWLNRNSRRELLFLEKTVSSG
jgi:hypothetical protein